MPTEQEIQQLHANLQTLAALIQTNEENIVDFNSTINEKATQRERRRAQLFQPILANKILYPNDAARTNALIEAYSLDAEYQNYLIAENAAITGKGMTQAESESQRKMFRADELLLLYYANNPTP